MGVDMLIMKKREAKALGLKTYFTGKPCKNGHYCKRYTIDAGCVECNKTRALQSYHKNKTLKSRKFLTDEEKKQYHRNWVEKNRDRIKKRHAEWRDKNRKKINQRFKKWRNENKEHFAAYQNAYNAIRRKGCKQNISKPFLSKIKSIYVKRDKIIKSTGIAHHVDHIVPLRGKNICGLHVPWNLQIITAEENQRKSNKFNG